MRPTRSAIRSMLTHWQPPRSQRLQRLGQSPSLWLLATSPCKNCLIEGVVTQELEARSAAILHRTNPIWAALIRNWRHRLIWRTSRPRRLPYSLMHTKGPIVALVTVVLTTSLLRTNCTRMLLISWIKSCLSSRQCLEQTMWFQGVEAVCHLMLASLTSSNFPERTIRAMPVKVEAHQTADLACSLSVRKVRNIVVCITTNLDICFL